MSTSVPTESGTRTIAYRVVRGMLTIMFFWTFWKFGGLILNVVVGRLFGSGIEAKAYFFSCQKVIYLLIFSTGLKVVAPAFIPLFIELRNNEGKKRAWDFAYTVLNLLLVAAVVLIVVLLVWARPITNTLVRGFSQEEREMGFHLLQIVIPGVAVLVASWLMTSLLNAYKAFGYSPAAEATQKLLWVVALYVTYKYFHAGVYAVAIGFLVGCCGQLLILLWGWRKTGGAYRLGFPMLSVPRIGIESIWLGLFVAGTAGLTYATYELVHPKWRDLALLTTALAGSTFYILVLWKRCKDRTSVIARFAALAAPLMMSTFFARYRDLVRNYFQSYTIQGYANFDYAMKIAMVPPVFIAYTLSIAMFPYLCELTAKKDSAAFSDLLSRTLRMLALGFVPLTLFTIILAQPIVRLVYDPGDKHAVHIFYMALSLQIIISALLFYAIENVVLQAFFSLQSMWVPTLLGIVATFFDISIQAIPIFVLGLDSPLQIFVFVAISFPLSRTFKNSILLYILHRKIHVFEWKPMLRFVGKLAIVSAASGLLAWGTLYVVRRALPYRGFRERKIVVDDFEPGPSSWVSLSWRTLAVTKAESGNNHFLEMEYPRGRWITSELTGSLEFLKPCTVSAVTMNIRSTKAITDLRACLTDASGKRHESVSQIVVAPSPSLSTQYEFRFQPAVQLPGKLELVDATAREKPIQRVNRENVLRLDNIRLLDPEGKVLWSQDFDGSGWLLDGKPALTLTTIGGDTPANALPIPEVTRSVSRYLSRINLKNCAHLRFKLYTPHKASAPVQVRLIGRDGTAYEREWRPEWEGWNRARLALDSFKNADGATALSAVADLARLEWVLPTRGETWAIREVNFYRPSRFAYEIIKFLHCAIPSGVGFVMLLLLAWVLKLEELRAVVDWVRQRGWRRRKTDSDDGDPQSPSAQPE